MRATEANNAMRLLKIIHIQMEEHANTMMEKYDLTAAQGDVLGYILEHEKIEINSTMIHQQLHLSRATISVLLKKLRAKGFLEFRDNPKDDRQKQIVLTAKAKCVQQELEKNLRKIQSCLFEEISEEEVEIMTDILKRMLTNLKKNDGKENVT